MTITIDPLQEFSDDDKRRLEESAVWQQDPHFVESMCRLFHEMDPMQCWSGENPHAMTEYLIEVDMLAKRMKSIHSVQDLALTLQAIFEEMFAGDETNPDWTALAMAAWQASTTFSGAQCTSPIGGS